jgi:hypothetical protein
MITACAKTRSTAVIDSWSGPKSGSSHTRIYAVSEESTRDCDFHIARGRPAPRRHSLTLTVRLLQSILPAYNDPVKWPPFCSVYHMATSSGPADSDYASRLRLRCLGLRLFACSDLDKMEPLIRTVLADIQGSSRTTGSVSRSGNLPDAPISYTRPVLPCAGCLTLDSVLHEAWLYAHFV